MKREFLQLSHTYNPRKHSVCGWFISEKLDGLRAFWDGGISRGMPTTEVPYANVEKDYRLTRTQIATGLWSRYGKVIHAPDWWLDHLPTLPLDGELYIGRQSFQQTVSTAKDHTPGPGWKDVKYMVLDAPPIAAVFSDGVINNVNFKKKFIGCRQWAAQKLGDIPTFMCFDSAYKYLCKLGDAGPFQVHQQYQLPFSASEADATISDMTDHIVELGGEGIILRRHVSIWTPGRVYTCLKHKPYNDAEGTVIGYTWGRETDKGSKLLGMMGALVLRLKNGKRLELSGFTEAERCMVGQGSEPYDHPGEVVSGDWYNPNFPIGDQVSFKYRDLTNEGIPKEARYWRKRND